MCREGLQELMHVKEKSNRTFWVKKGSYSLLWEKVGVNTCWVVVRFPEEKKGGVWLGFILYKGYIWYFELIVGVKV